MLQALAPRSTPIPRACRSTPWFPVPKARHWENRKPVEPMDMVRMIATARIVMPKSRVRLSAGRNRIFSKETQLLCSYGRRQLDLLR